MTGQNSTDEQSDMERLVEQTTDKDYDEYMEEHNQTPEDEAADEDNEESKDGVLIAKGYYISEEHNTGLFITVMLTLVLVITAFLNLGGVFNLIVATIVSINYILTYNKYFK